VGKQKTKRPQPSRVRAALSLVKADPRVALLFWFCVSVVVLWIASPHWSWLPQLLAVLRVAAVSAVAVMAIILWSVRHFSVFSRLDRILTRVPVAGIGIALIGYAVFKLYAAPRPAQRVPLTETDASQIAALFFGWFLFFWVFLFYGRKRSTN